MARHIYLSIYACIFVRLLLEEVDLAVEEELPKILKEPSHQAAKLACESEAVSVLKIKVWFAKSRCFSYSMRSPSVTFQKAQQKPILDDSVHDERGFSFFSWPAMDISWNFQDC